MKVAFYTLGCKINQYETEAMIDMFKKEGYEIVSHEEPSDVFVINTCTVTNMSDRKSRQMIRKAHKLNPNGVISVVGCYAQTNPADILEIPEVDVVVGSSRKNEIVSLVEKAKRENIVINAVDDIMKVKAFEETPITDSMDRTRVNIKIQEGCQQFCSYCIIPYARGPIRSRMPKEIIKEVERVASHGFKEVVLNGIHVASYGKDFKDTEYNGIDLLEIIKMIAKIDGIERIRLSSMEPTYLTEERIIELSKINKLCNHYHLSLQSGCDDTLKRMNRKYTTAQYKEVVENLRKNIEDVAITTDVIVGFPGETDEEFAITYKFLEEIQLTKLHVFRYSKRKGTVAAKIENQVSDEDKNKRSHLLIKLSDECTNNFYSNYLNKTVRVLVEQEVNENTLEGHTTNYIKVVFRGDTDLKGEIINVKIDNLHEDYLKGTICIE